jgi:hypothetical protein
MLANLKRCVDAGGKFAVFEATGEALAAGFAKAFLLATRI